MAKNRGVRISFLILVKCACLWILQALKSYTFYHRSLAEMAAATSVHVVTIIEPIIQHADWFFPEGENYNSELYFP